VVIVMLRLGRIRQPKTGSRQKDIMAADRSSFMMRRPTVLVSSPTFANVPASAEHYS
jgi:hypothetical protein